MENLGVRRPVVGSIALLGVARGSAEKAETRDFCIGARTTVNNVSRCELPD